jgi:hypothetical protein
MSLADRSSAPTQDPTLPSAPASRPESRPWPTPSGPRSAAAHPPEGLARRLLPFLVPLAFALAARLPYFVGSDFPLNDGGLFVAMSRDVLAAHFALPEVTSYNAEGIAFAYPPVAFYLVAGITRLTGIDAIDLARWLPLLANLGTVVAVTALARGLLGPGSRAAVLSVVIFALIPRSYEWLIMGGGLTRSFGFLFAVTCLAVARQLFSRPTLGRMLACMVLAGLAMATHLELGLFVLYSLGLMALCYGHGVAGLGRAALIGVAGVALGAPWWATVLARQGVAPFVAASHTGEWTSVVEQLQGLEEFMTPPKLLLSLPGGLAILGVLACLMRRQPFVPLWLPLIFLLNPRSAATQATLPLSLLAALGLTEVVGPGLLAARERARAARPVLAQPRWLVSGTGGLGSRLVLASLGLALTGVFLSWPSLHPNRHALDVLSPADREAMRWIGEQTAPDQRFLVLTRGWTWEDDHVSEWFPVLTGRRSVLTVQATEWLPDQLFARTHCLYDQARQLGSLEWGVDRLDQWAIDRGVVFSDVYVSSSITGVLDWRPLVESARESSIYRVAYDQGGVVVLERREPITPRWPTSGELVVANDCSSLGEQPGDTREAFEEVYGPGAARAWVDAHNQALGMGLRRLDRLRQLLIGTGRRSGA